MKKQTDQETPPAGNGQTAAPRKTTARKPLGSGLQTCARIERLMAELEDKQRNIVVNWFVGQYVDNDPVASFDANS